MPNFPITQLNHCGESATIDTHQRYLLLWGAITFVPIAQDVIFVLMVWLYFYFTSFRPKLQVWNYGSLAKLFKLCV